MCFSMMNFQNNTERFKRDSDKMQKILTGSYNVNVESKSVEKECFLLDVCLLGIN